jgi:glycosyltransferase 2 family protein
MKFKKYLQVILFLGIGLLIFRQVYRNLSISDLMAAMAHLSYPWIVAAFCICLCSNFLRALRWKMLLVPTGHNTGVMTLFLSILILYFVNLIVPRGGEVARCGIVTWYERVPFSKLLGTVVVERLSDLIAYFFIFTGALVWKFDFIKRLFFDNSALRFNQVPFIMRLATAAAIGVLVLIVFYAIQKAAPSNRLAAFLGKMKTNISQGMTAIVRTESKTAYAVYTFAIYLLWVIVLYMMFLSIGPTHGLSMGAALLTSVVSTLAFLLPIQAGIGVWHLLAIQCLLFYGVDEQNGKIVALIIHTLTNIVFPILGAGAAGVLLLVTKKRHACHNQCTK